jgi:hypothetical protein
MPDMLAGHGRTVGEEFDGVGRRKLCVRQDRTSGLHHRLPIQVSLISSFVSVNVSALSKCTVHKRANVVKSCMYCSVYVLSVSLSVVDPGPVDPKLICLMDPVPDPVPDPDPLLLWPPSRIRMRNSGLRIRVSSSDQKEIFTDPQHYFPQSKTGSQKERFLTRAQITVHAPFLAASEVKMICFISNDTSLQSALNTKTENQIYLGRLFQFTEHFVQYVFLTIFT